MSSKRTPNEIGSSAERRAAALLGGRVIGGSGSGKFLKLDVRDLGHFIYSIKATDTIRDTALRAIARLWREANQGARGAAGHGDGAKPAMIFELEGELLVLLRAEDHAAMATGEVAPYITPSKAQERRSRALRRPSEQ
jgi:hypothetical protein